MPTPNRNPHHDVHQTNGVPRRLYDPIVVDLPRRDLPRWTLAASAVLLCLGLTVLAAAVLVTWGRA